MDSWIVLIGIIVVSIFGLISLKFRIVDYSGLIAGILVGISVFIFPNDGWKWFIILLAFHLVAGQFTKYKYDVKRRTGMAQEKGGARAWPNVAANGVIAAVLALSEGIFGGKIFFAGFLGAIGTATSDTLATEVGLLNPKPPRLITKLSKKVSPGTSGGISPLGEIATLFGSFIIGALAWILHLGGPLLEWDSFKLILVALIAGTAGCTFDSLLGASIQGLYRCAVCGKITDNKRHCDRTSRHITGIIWLDNNMVNFLSTIVGAITAMLVFILF